MCQAVSRVDTVPVFMRLTVDQERAEGSMGTGPPDGWGRSKGARIRASCLGEVRLAFSVWSGCVEQKKSDTKVDTTWDSIFLQNGIGNTHLCWWQPEPGLHFREVMAWKGIKGNLLACVSGPGGMCTWVNLRKLTELFTRKISAGFDFTYVLQSNVFK